MPIELGILGAGNMAEAIVRGLVAGGTLPREQILASDLSAARRAVFADELGVTAVEDNLRVARDARVLLLSVKPQHMGELLFQIGPVLDPQTLVVSIAAGVTCKYIETRLHASRPFRVIRTMPNTPMLVGEGMVAVARGSAATEDDLARARRLFEPSARVIEVDESQMDAVTAVSGSGPAYVFFLAEQMIRAGIELGLPPDSAKQLALQTISGAARMLVTSSDSPQELRRKVTSPNGTTHAAITHMERNGLPQTLVDAVKAAAYRSKELGG